MFLYILLVLTLAIQNSSVQNHNYLYSKIQIKNQSLVDLKIFRQNSQNSWETTEIENTRFSFSISNQPTKIYINYEDVKKIEGKKNSVVFEKNFH